jgi:hypothetical protein
MTEVELRRLWEAADVEAGLEPMGYRTCTPSDPYPELAMASILARSGIRNRLVDVHREMDAWEERFLATELTNSSPEGHT